MHFKKLTHLAVDILITTFYLLNVAHSQSQVYNGTCEKFDQIFKPVYVNWPFRIDCDNLRSIWESKPEKNDQDVIMCEMTYNGSFIDEGIQELTSFDDDTLYTAKLIINESVCISNDIRIEFQVPHESCQQYINQSMADDHVIFREASIGDSVELECIPPLGIPEIIPKGSDKSQFYTKWYINCMDEDYRETNLWREIENPGYPKTLYMPTVDFWDAARFTCTVEYKGQQLYVVTYAQCIKQQVEQIKPTITCIKEKTEAPDHDTILNCTGQIVFGETSSEDLLMTWKKDGKTICENRYFNKTVPGLNNRQSCIAKANNDSLVCVTDGSKNTEIQKGRKSVAMSLSIRNLHFSDYGKYDIELQFRDYKTGIWQNDIWRMTLIEDKTPFYEKLIIAFSVTFAVILPAIILYGIYRYFKIYILLLYKRSSLRKYDEDDREYVAYLSYFYNKGMMSNENLEATEKIIQITHKLLENSHFKYYDEQRESDFSVQVEQLTNMIGRCHRMIIVLSPEYLQDNWRRFHAELGFHGLMSAGMGLLFILLPNVDKLLKESARDDKVWKDLRRAMKMNPVIRFKYNMSDEKLRDSIDCYLPKLRRIEQELNFNHLLHPEYLRGLSQTTACTEVA